MKNRQVKTGLICLLCCGLLAAGCGKETEKPETPETGSSSVGQTSASASSAEADSAESAAESAGSAADSAESPYQLDEDLLSIPTIEGDFKLSDCIKLGEYKGLDLTMEIEEVTDADVEEYLSYQVQPAEVDDPDAVLQEGDTANLDYVGKKDGVAFDGGTGEGYDLEIGSGTFIAGFEEGMIGMKKGEVRDLDLTFPENYGVEELAGQDVVFTVTLNAIKRLPDLDDAWAEEFSEGEFLTLEDLKASNRSEMEEQNRSSAENDLKAKAWSEILDRSEFLAFPESYLNEGRDDFDQYMDSQMEMYGVELEEYLEQMDVSEEEYEKLREQDVRTEVQNRLVLEAVIEAEGITKDSKEYEERLDELLKQYNMEKSEFFNFYGEDVVDEYVFSEMAIERILGTANITEKVVPAADSTYEDLDIDDIEIEEE